MHTDCKNPQPDKKWQSDSSSAACKKRIGSFYLAVNRNKSKENLPLNYEGDFR